MKIVLNECVVMLIKLWVGFVPWYLYVFDNHLEIMLKSLVSPLASKSNALCTISKTQFQWMYVCTHTILNLSIPAHFTYISPHSIMCTYILGLLGIHGFTMFKFGCFPPSVDSPVLCCFRRPCWHSTSPCRERSRHQCQKQCWGTWMSLYYCSSTAD